MLLQHGCHITVETRHQVTQSESSCPPRMETMRHRPRREAERDQADCHPVPKLESERFHPWGLEP
jgi:hypothetical protein